MLARLTRTLGTHTAAVGVALLVLGTGGGLTLTHTAPESPPTSAVAPETP